MTNIIFYSLCTANPTNSNPQSTSPSRCLSEIELFSYCCCLGNSLQGNVGLHLFRSAWAVCSQKAPYSHGGSFK